MIFWLFFFLFPVACGFAAPALADDYEGPSGYGATGTTYELDVSHDGYGRGASASETADPTKYVVVDAESGVTEEIEGETVVVVQEPEPIAAMATGSISGWMGTAPQCRSTTCSCIRDGISTRTSGGSCPATIGRAACTSALAITDRGIGTHLTTIRTIPRIARWRFSGARRGVQRPPTRRERPALGRRSLGLRAGRPRSSIGLLVQRPGRVPIPASSANPG